MKRALMLTLLVATELSLSAQPGSRIVRFEPNGPAGVGLKGNDRDSSKIHHYYRSKADERVAAGIWSSPDFSGRMRVVDSTEFIYILEGAVTLLDKSGREETFKAGDAVLIPRGTEFQWKKTDNLKEYWVIFDRQAEGVRPPQGEPMFFKLSADGPAGKGLTANKNGRTREHEYFSGSDGSSVGVWETQPNTSADFHETKYAELMLFLSGNVTLSTPDGQVERFKAGEVALVPKGIRYKWSSDTVRKFWVIFDAQATAPQTAGR